MTVLEHCTHRVRLLSQPALIAVLAIFMAGLTYAAESPLFSSIAALDRAAFDHAIASGADVNQADAYGQTPLMYAVVQRQFGLSAALLAAGSDARAATHAGWTALHYAANHWAPPALVTLLLEAGATPRALNGSGETAEDIAARIGNQPFLDATTAFTQAVRGRLMDAIMSLDGASFAAALEYGADVDQVDEFGQTPLMYAVAANQFGMVRRLLEAEAAVNARSVAGWTALHYAARAGVTETIATALMEAGASRSAANYDGETASDVAQREGNASFLAVDERFEAAERARAEADRRAASERAEADRRAAAGRAASAAVADSSPNNTSRTEAAPCTPWVTTGRTQTVFIEDTAWGQEAFWRQALSSTFGSSVSRSGSTYFGIDTLRRAVFIAEVPYAHSCGDGRAVIDIAEVRACAVQFDARSISGSRPSQIDVHLANQSTTTVRVELPPFGQSGLDRLATCTVTRVGW